MSLPGPIRKGDLVEAVKANGKVPIGTVGKVLSVTGKPHLPGTTCYVEWQLQRHGPKREWHSLPEIAPLTSDE